MSSNQLSGAIPLLNKTNLRYLSNLHLEHNQFTFAGMENIAIAFPFAVYAPQASISVTQNGNVFTVSAGGTISNNTYNWYKNGVLFKTKTGNKRLTVNGNGRFSVVVTNSIATELTLYSDTVTVNNLFQQNTNVSSPEELKSNFSIYPNPVKSIATILFNATGKTIIKLTDVSGNILQTKKVIAKGMNIIQLDVNKYAAGIYFISMINEGIQLQTLQLNKE